AICSLAETISLKQSATLPSTPTQALGRRTEKSPSLMRRSAVRTIARSKGSACTPLLPLVAALVAPAAAFEEGFEEAEIPFSRTAVAVADLSACCLRLSVFTGQSWQEMEKWVGHREKFFDPEIVGRFGGVIRL